MNNHDFRKHAHQLVDWMADYLEQKENYPVTPDIQPGEIYDKFPDKAPEDPATFDEIFTDFEEGIIPGMTNWQHPMFFGYFPANTSAPSILAEMLMSTLGAQCMSWLTSPAATELEERVVNWLRDAKGLDSTWKGVIQDTASTATLCAILAARERASQFSVNEKGFSGQEKFRVYSSQQAHSSVDKAMRIAGLGHQNLVKIPVDNHFAMIPEALEGAIEADIQNGFSPLCVVSALGTTSSTAIDPIGEIGKVAARFGMWHHIDAAYAGTALLLPEFRWMIEGHELADSYVFNPHKWMFTNFDCSVLFVKNADDLVHTFSMTTEYLKTDQDEHVHNYRDWGIQLGRRFRALKLWWVIRAYGLAGIREKLRGHLELTKLAKKWAENEENVIVETPNILNVFCFRFVEKSLSTSQQNDFNKTWMDRVNASGKVFFTSTILNGNFVMRWVIGQTDVKRKHIQIACDCLKTELEIVKKAYIV
ncbi:pyridoxal phosphate-dependent decarboxylase family protein [Echinicola rosea]|uniref:Aspartate aminotransferase family protein n=1 Tax=Echinicola rosea TaxID=1807691 RepID=A0ABQ1UX74_9BACT|nr:pyridoxal-dependent decarboxylase [Echinicola rosea]GGF28005.1 aspartate aminotransferase family protein [Echinicola rosea]